MYYDFWTVKEEELLKRLGFQPVNLAVAVIAPKNADELKYLAEKNKTADFIVLHKPNEKVLKVAVDNCNIDATDEFVKYPLIKKMAERNIAVLINFNELLKAFNLQKTLYLMSRTVKLAKRHKTPIIISSGAQTKWELRSASDLIGFCEVIGMTAGEAKKTLYDHQERVLNRKELKKTGKWVSPGVRVV
jgi:RNase P/RNase MRP subunit p30